MGSLSSIEMDENVLVQFASIAGRRLLVFSDAMRK